MSLQNTSKPRAVLFDWDNTLVDNWDVLLRVMNITLESMGHRPWSNEEGHRNIRKTANELFPELFADGAERAKEIFYDAFAVEHIQHLKLIEGAEDLLQMLAAQNIMMGVVSNKNSHYLRKECDHLNWNHYFKTLVGAGDTQKGKPAPDPALLALEHMQLSASNDIWFIGDTDVDILTAHHAGLHPIYIATPRMAESEKTLQTSLSDIQFSTVRSLQELAILLK